MEQPKFIMMPNATNVKSSNQKINQMKKDEIKVPQDVIEYLDEIYEKAVKAEQICNGFYGVDFKDFNKEQLIKLLTVSKYLSKLI